MRKYRIAGRQLFTLTACFLLSCSGTRTVSNTAKDRPFTVIDASYEQWHAGRPEGGSGTDYRFITVIHSDKDVQFDSVWIRDKNKTLPLAVGRLRGPVSNTQVMYAQGDTILLFASIEEPATPTSSHAPIATEAAALMHFQVNNRKLRFPVSALNKTEGPARPQ